MEILNKITDISHYPKIVVALGTFDGLHVGHKAVIGRAVNIAKKIGGTCVVFTFSNHPLNVLAPALSPPMLLNETDKCSRIEEMGVDIMMSVPFTE